MAWITNQPRHPSVEPRSRKGAGFSTFCYTKDMKLSRVIFVIAAIIVGVWLLGLLIKLAAWFINSLLYIAADIVIIGLIRMYFEKRKNAKLHPENTDKEL